MTTDASKVDCPRCSAKVVPEVGLARRELYRSCFLCINGVVPEWLAVEYGLIEAGRLLNSRMGELDDAECEALGALRISAAKYKGVV